MSAPKTMGRGAARRVIRTVPGDWEKEKISRDGELPRLGVERLPGLEQLSGEGGKKAPHALHAFGIKLQ